MATPLAIQWLGVVPYGEALERQKAAVAARREGLASDRLWLLEHPPAVTLGRSAKPENVRTPLRDLQARGVEIHEVSRGGDVTYHGLGQLVGYLIADLEARGEADVHRFLRRIEAALVQALGRLGIAADTRPGMTGVFVAPSGEPGATGDAVAGGEAPRKIASIGVGLRGWVSYHGFALNATLDLGEFDDIVPCGLHGVEMTSVARELDEAPERALFERTRAVVGDAFAQEFA